LQTRDKFLWIQLRKEEKDFRHDRNRRIIGNEKTSLFMLFLAVAWQRFGAIAQAGESLSIESRDQSGDRRQPVWHSVLVSLRDAREQSIDGALQTGHDLFTEPTLHRH
jgi:hypothetical protein